MRVKSFNKSISLWDLLVYERAIRTLTKFMGFNNIQASDMDAGQSLWDLSVYERAIGTVDLFEHDYTKGSVLCSY